MKKHFLVPALAVFFLSCNQHANNIKPDAVLYDSSYQSAGFTDAGRLEKISKAFPIIDKLFKDYADSNHFPGLAFGIVVDGKLVYKDN